MTRETQSGWDCSRLSEGMVHESAPSEQEPMRDKGVWRAMFHHFFSKVCREAQLEVRTGYQDETGFHMGVKPAENEIQWPPVW
jgi:hypothetical protein